MKDMQLWRMIERSDRVLDSTLCVEAVYKFIDDHFHRIRLSEMLWVSIHPKILCTCFINPAASSECGQESRHNSLLSGACATLQGGR